MFYSFRFTSVPIVTARRVCVDFSPVEGVVRRECPLEDGTRSGSVGPALADRRGLHYGL